MKHVNFPSRGTAFHIIAASCSDVEQTQNGKGTIALCEPPDQQSARQLGKLYLLADGVEGHIAGGVASRIAAETIPAVYYDRKCSADHQERSMPSSGYAGLPPARLQQAFFAAHMRIRWLSTYKQAYAGMATSCVAAVVQGTRLWIAHVGDCRAYLIRSLPPSRRQIACLTTDHSLITRLVQVGDISPEQACHSPVRHILLRALGGWEGNDPTPDFALRDLHAGEHVILCCDDLWSQVPEKQMAQVVCEMPPAEACAEFVRLSKEAGSTEHTSAIVLSFQ